MARSVRSCMTLLALGLVACVCAGRRTGMGALRRSAWQHVAAVCFVVGTVLFSGSLYAYALSAQRASAMITPIGGTFFLLGWASLLVFSCRATSAQG